MDIFLKKALDSVLDQYTEQEPYHNQWTIVCRLLIRNSEKTVAKYGT